MLIFIIAYLGGVLTILSPCILPVLPFVFAKAQNSFFKSGLPLLLGMSLTFSIFSVLAIVGGDLLTQANDTGRIIALIFFGAMGVSLVFPQISDKIFSPIAGLGGKIGRNPEGEGFLSSLIVGIGTGLLWAPCAGPILGLVLTGASVQGNVTKSIFLLIAYSMGAATSLGLALFAGKKVFTKMKSFLGIERGIRKALGIFILIGVAIIAFNLDRTILTKISRVNTETVEQKLLSMTGLNQEKKQAMIPDFSGLSGWINSTPLTNSDLKGKVVLIDIWTYSCINCLRTLPYVKTWYEKYKSNGFVVIGVHSPEFGFEKIESNVKTAVKDLGITYPVVMDNEFKIWNELQNSYWPAHYFVDRSGKIRHVHFGEGGYEESEEKIRSLIEENGEKHPISTIGVDASGVQATSNLNEIKSPETYLGYGRAENYVGTPSSVGEDSVENYITSRKLSRNQWSLEGTWLVESERALLKSKKGKISFKFHARDLHLVLASSQVVQFKVKIDGQEPRGNHGIDINEKGIGEIKGQRLYQLLRLKKEEVNKDHLFEIEFMDSEVEAYAFTFG